MAATERASRAGNAGEPCQKRGPLVVKQTVTWTAKTCSPICRPRWLSRGALMVSHPGVRQVQSNVGPTPFWPLLRSGYLWSFCRSPSGTGSAVLAPPTFGMAMNTVRRALLLSSGERYLTIAFNFATMAAVSRILTPGEVGVSVICLAILGMAMSAREFASSSFIIQHPSLSRKDIRGAFSLMLTVSLGISVLLVAAAPALASSFGEKELVPYLRVVSVCVVVDTVAIQVIALLRRDMAFGKVALINVSGAATAGIATVVLALAGFSYMSFAWAWFACSVVTALLALVLWPHLWMFKPTFSQWRGMTAFGGYNGAMVLLSKAYEALPPLLLGRMISPGAAALFSRGLTVCQIPDKLILGGAISVVLPAFSQSLREGSNLKRPYLGALEMITCLHWPVLLVLAALSYPAVDILLGRQWKEAALLVQIIAVASLFSFSFELNYPVMVAMGSIRDMFLRTLIVIPVSIAVMAAAILSGGLHGAALSLMFIVPFQAFVTLSFVRRRLSIKWRELAAAVSKSAVVAAASMVGPAAVLIANGLDFQLSLGQAVFAGALAAAGWICGLVATRHPLLDEMLGALRVFRHAAALRFSF